MKCRCGSELKRVPVDVYGASRQVISHQCPSCDYFEFEPESSRKVVKDLRH